LKKIDEEQRNLEETLHIP
jgi:hypothetical protein